MSRHSHSEPCSYQDLSFLWMEALLVFLDGAFAHSHHDKDCQPLTWRQKENRNTSNEIALFSIKTDPPSDPKYNLVLNATLPIIKYFIHFYVHLTPATECRTYAAILCRMPCSIRHKIDLAPELCLNSPMSFSIHLYITPFTCTSLIAS